MHINTCVICQAKFEAPRKRQVCSDTCRKAKDRMRKNSDWANQHTKDLTCSVCQTIFQHRDHRKNTCSTKCAYQARAKVMEAKHGYSNPGQKPRTEEEKALIGKKKSKTYFKRPVEDRRASQEKRIATNLERYGEKVPNNEARLEKIKATNEERFGGVSPFSDRVVREKARQTFLARYGNPQFPQSDEWKAQMLAKFGSEQVFNSPHFEEIMDEINTLESKGEREVREFVESLGLSTKKTRIDNQEIDVYIPEKWIGIEYHGLYWHCELHKASDYHYQKYKTLAKAGVDVIQIYESEWSERKEQIKSRLRSILGANENRVGARKCEIGQAEKDSARRFLKKYHIQGAPQSIELALGLYFQGDLVSLATFGRHHRNNELNVLNRFVTKDNWTISGGLSRLTRHAASILKADLISWCDLRWSGGNGYTSAGWELEEWLRPDYAYVSKSFKKIVPKQMRRKSLVGTPGDVTEREHAHLEGLYRIYDCGKYRFRYRFKKE